MASVGTKTLMDGRQKSGFKAGAGLSEWSCTSTTSTARFHGAVLTYVK
jgi:hypothetical protein